MGEEQHIVSKNDVEIGRKIINSYQSRKGVFKNYTSVSKNDVGMDNDIYLNYITFISAIDYAKGRKANKLWKNAKQWVEKYNWIFKPEEIKKKNVSEIMEVFNNLRLNYGDVFRVQDIGIWLTISNALNSYDGKTSYLIECFDYDASKIYTSMNGILKKKFPFLSGDKILPMWLKTLNTDANIHLSNMDKIPLPVDRNVARITYNLIFKKEFNIDVNKNIIKNVRAVWTQIANEINIPVIDLDTPLWILGGEGCSRNNCKVCPNEVKIICHAIKH